MIEERHMPQALSQASHFVLLHLCFSLTLTSAVAATTSGARSSAHLPTASQIGKDVRALDAGDPDDDQAAMAATAINRLLELDDAFRGETSEPTVGDPGNLTQLLMDRFAYLFSTNESGAQASEHMASLNKLAELFTSVNANASVGQLTGDHQASQLETRATIRGHHFGSPAAPADTGVQSESSRRSFVRVQNRVFSRVELPEWSGFKRSGPTAASRSSGGLSSANLSSSPLGGATNSGTTTSGSSSSSVPSGGGQPAAGHCGSHIGCIAELPNFPMILKLKPNVSASFTIYTRERGGHRGGQRILFEPLMHYQLQDGERLSDQALHREAAELANLTRPSVKLEKLLPHLKPHHFNTRRHHHHHHLHLAHLGATANYLGRHEAVLRQRLQTTATSWASASNRVVASRELPFDLAALEQSGFNASLTTRIIIGGYFAKEDEEWIDELVKQWLLLEPSNVIKVSWQDSNRGLYHSAAYNSRIVGRQLSLFLHYLNELFHIDLNRFHLVGHSLGAHIAGFVGADNEGQIARITGLDPAGPIFVELNQAHRLDSSDAKFVDVVHTNGGTITKGALGLSTPSGHVDYYCNGGSLQPGCFFSSVTMSIMDPVERIACNHRRSYRYFTEIIKMAIKQSRVDDERLPQPPPPLSPGGTSENRNLMNNDEQSEVAAALRVDESKFPQAFLFEAKQEDLVKLVQPDVRLVRAAGQFQAPMRKLVEFHSLDPDFPREKHGLYYFRTRTETPFFGSKQFALRFSLEQAIKRKITLSIKVNTTLVAELELDELDESRSLVFVLQNPHLIDHASLFSGRSSRAPDLWLMWRQRSFNLLLAHQNELHLNSIELDLLDGVQDEEEKGGGVRAVWDESSGNSTTHGELSSAAKNSTNRIEERQRPARNFVVRYEPNVVNSNNNENFLSRIQHNNQVSSGFLVARNQWHKFDGRPMAVSA